MPVPVDPNVVYPEIESYVKIGEDAVTAEKMKEWLGWEDEDTYKQRMEQRDKKKATVGFGEEFLLKDPAGKKIRCWYNTKNRPFSLQWSKAIAQDILHSGPNLPLESRAWQVNGEPIIFGRYGQCLSGQHRGVGLILAVHEYRKNKEYWQEHGGWPHDPVLETIITVGIDESSRTTRTMDNVKPRSLADVFYTSGTFDNLRQSQREECSRMLQTAINFIWKRTGVSEDEAVKFQTHAESVSFFDRHPKLIECVDHIYKLNSGGEGRNISALNLSPGLVTGMLYLMGCSGSDPDDYLSGINARSEKALTWGNWGEACGFWTAFASGLESFAPVKDALNSLIDPELGAGGRQIEKVGVIAKAWTLFFVGEDFTEERLKLEYYKDDTTGKLNLVIDDDFPTFGGIDSGEPAAKKDGAAPPTPQEIADRAAQVKEVNRIAELDATVKSRKSRSSANNVEANGEPHQPDTMKNQMLRDIKEAHPGKVVLFRTKDGGGKFWSNDAVYVAKVLNKPITKDEASKLDFLKVEPKDVDQVKLRLLAAKARLAICELRPGQTPSYEVVDVQPPTKLGAR